MAEHDEETERRESGAQASRRLRTAVSGLLGLATTAVRIVGAVFALILVIHIILYVFEANPDNALTEFFANVSGGLDIWFDDLFTLDSSKFEVLVNDGIAAIFWLVAAAVAARILQAIPHNPAAG